MAFQNTGPRHSRQEKRKIAPVNEDVAGPFADKTKKAGGSIKGGCHRQSFSKGGGGKGFF